MEASGAAPAAADTGEGQGEAQEGQEGQGFDLSPVLDRMDQFEQRFDGLEQRLPEETPEGEGPEGEDQLYITPDGAVVDEFGNPAEGYNEGYEQDPQAMMQQALQQQEQRLRQEYEQKLQEQIGPLQERFQDMDLGALEERYPQLRDQQTAESTLRAAEQRAEAYGKPELAKNAQFLEETYLAGLARERGLSEVPADSEEPGFGLEQPGAQTPGEPEEDPGQRIVDARGPRSFWT